ncbi:hypothetical protein Rhe02_78120 [Rhizocola hellebori]|uniref:Uncharacterized protein n=1 Tax=Rhizocola hellebori TaxID=1392758 RepID=A0A8J3VKH7_9ACTN|nr:hypothetical protein [Rhizocola hellebori]GIH09745.1 hypothetical protein Rhe02_78120 [Rhizocola hellebori]
MMDRRKFVVGGSAAAVAVTLGAVAGGGVAGAEPTSAAEHARRVLDQVDVDAGLVNPDGLRRQFEQSYEAFLASAPRDPEANDLDAWIRSRMMGLCGTDSYVAALTEIPSTRSLLAFSFLVYSQNQDTPLPSLAQSMRTPTLLRILEPDFLPALVGQIDERSLASREFASALETSANELDRIFAEKLRGSAGRWGRAKSAPSNGDTAGYIAGVLIFIAFLYWIKGGLK